MAFEVKLAFEGLVDRFDGLAQRFEEPGTGSFWLAFAGGLEQLDASLVKFGRELSAEVLFSRSASADTCPVGLMGSSVRMSTVALPRGGGQP